jgi:hypothetical protein
MACNNPTSYRRHQRRVIGLLVLYRILCMQCHFIIQQGLGGFHSRAKDMKGIQSFPWREQVRRIIINDYFDLCSSWSSATLANPFSSF